MLVAASKAGDGLPDREQVSATLLTDAPELDGSIRPRCRSGRNEKTEEEDQGKRFHGFSGLRIFELMRIICDILHIFNKKLQPS